jgi:hypothetical protein
MLISSREVQAMSSPASAIPASCSVRRLAPFPSIVVMSKWYESRVRRGASVSITCSPWSASTMVVPTWPAPMRMIFTASGRLQRGSARNAGIRAFAQVP